MVPTLVATGVSLPLRVARGQGKDMGETTRYQRRRHAGQPVAIRQFVYEWLVLELAGHVGLIALRQLCGTWWSWRTGGPFAYWDVSRAMLHGDFWWVVAVVCTSAIRHNLLAEWD